MPIERTGCGELTACKASIDYQSVTYTYNQHQVALLAQISLTHSLPIHPYRPSLPAGPPDYILCLYRPVVRRFTLAGQHLHTPCKGFHKRTSLLSSSLLLQQCPACFVHHIWIILEIRGKCPDSCLFGGVASRIRSI